ncbi:uncharacterized protein LOC110833520 isoform X2 [Zootermopsis nevadensis]|nr:uncharacterized protein LOC110833520 isoform X2 [Zootermopsis nevadensis]XP_021927382.1 uncharacterized protein LOC110833520 isoform X2 [Zootermopsis nevadensis]
MKHSLSSIKEEMEYCLKQSQVPCYTDGKVYDYYHRITQLELKYKATLRKLRKCDHVTKEGTSPSLPYKQKANRCVPAQLHKIHTPVLDKPENRIVTEQPTVTQCEAEFMDRPLEFQALKREEMQETKEPKIDIIHPLGIDYSSSDEETQQ